MNTVVVAGATGYLGRHLVAELERRGYRVRALARPGKAVDGASEVFHGEATRAATLTGLCDGAELVISSLGITRQSDRVTFEDVDHRANGHVLAEAMKAGVGRFAFVSVVHPDVFAASALVRARERFSADLTEAPVDSCLIRSTGFFSDMKEPLEMARRGRVFLMGDGSNRINPIHGTDLATACVDALLSSDTERAVGGPETFTWNEVARMAFEAMDRRPRVIHVPDWMVGAVLPAVRPFNRRAFDIASFVRIVMTHDIVAPQTGHRRLADSFREWAGEKESRA